MNVLVQYLIRDFLYPDIGRTKEIMSYIRPLLRINDSQLESFITRSECEYYFSLSWILTWHSHVVYDRDDLLMLTDLFLAFHPLIPIYVATVVDFIWINHDQKHFEWFMELLNELEMEQNEYGTLMDRFLDMHMYITSALQRTDVKALGLQMALDLIHKEKNIDLITGLKTRTQTGRPNWDKGGRERDRKRKKLKREEEGEN
ncbi:PREDICTED: uncharacterized protein LOC109586003 isoform X1 [Amphimedon queenslandica]|uniref:Ferric reductase NAD binding domain-containing protein n=1 Tax=Amphimedon queenslandica TaxID=400682 RepID=A0AAN0JLM6_AMPQE|nr:PREDICTED: uncharacterized protein LOC109586003 isoform X1 [Amphimedon queenslandica]|eukprot:XP_019857720.1 PREDICTED: uncharacterized protein LOC109586003 isoform X1 [Amphimedon queenslandica]